MQSYSKEFPFLKKKYKILSVVLTVFILLTAGQSNRLYAQMFSVGDSGPDYSRPMSGLFMGLELMDVTYEGEPEGIVGTEAGAFEFDGPVLRLGYDTPGINLFLGTGGKITGIDDAAYFDVGGNVDFGIRLYRSEKVFLQLPIRIASRYTNITNSRQVFATVNRFEFGSLAFGAGARVVVHPREDIRIEAAAIPGYGFSFATGGLFGGSIGNTDGQTKIYFDRLFNDIGLSFGYTYNLRDYNVDDDVYDYKIRGHSMELGITF